MACPNCGSEEKPLVVQRFIRRSVTTAFYHYCLQEGLRTGVIGEVLPVPAGEVTWPPISLLSNPRPVNWERE